jgi:hypothetical protein
MFTGEKVKVAELVPNKWVLLEVLVGVKTRSNQYAGCPTCFRAVDENGICPSCGKVTPIILTWEDYSAGDETGEIILSFPPRLTLKGENLEGKVLLVKGILQQTGEFRVQGYKELSVPSVAQPQPQPVKTETFISPPPSPPTPPAPPQPPQPITSEQIFQKEVEALSKVLDIFPEVSYEDLKMWHAARKLVTPLDKLIEAVARVSPDGIVRKK